VPTSERDRDPLDGVLIGGREQVPIVVVDYDEDWPDRFGLVRDRVRAALGASALRVEHIGSTSVPGLAAKPIIDVLVTVRNVEDEAAFVPLLERAGFVLRVREPEHRMVRTPARDVHVHLYEPDHEAVSAYLDLRDWLRVDADDRALYERTKRLLATRTWTDMNEYADAKTDVIQAILGRARAWRAAEASTVDTPDLTPRVLVIGLDPYRVPGPWDPEPVAAGIEVGRARFAEHGVGAEFCLLGLDGSDDVDAVVTEALRARRWECVVVGGGVRNQPELLERVVDRVRRHAPRAAIAFNATPADTFEAAARWLDAPGP
jgi:GrpB-like predicted nucleotidyltransferase (UPF0157 family)